MIVPGGDYGMNMTVTHEAATWFQKELGVFKGDSVRLFVRYGGESTIHPGFSLGLSVEPPSEIGLSTNAEGILVFMRDDEVWYLDDGNLTIHWDEAKDELEYRLLP